jgi:uncharacterized protein YbjT (DUF2867 family)
VFLEGFFQRLAAAGVQERDELVLPLGDARTSPISAVDVARAVAAILDNPAAHIGQIYNLTGYESVDLKHYASAFSAALGRTISYRAVAIAAWIDKLRGMGVPDHLLRHLAVMAELHQQGRYDRMTDDVYRLTGQHPVSMREFVERNAAAFTKPATAV